MSDAPLEEQIYSDLIIDLPDILTKEKEFSKNITSFAINHHGCIMAVGFKTGKIVWFDSHTFQNKYVLKEIASSIVSICFSRDSRQIIAGDQTGKLHFIDTLAKAIKCQVQLESKILELHPHPRDVSKTLVILSNKSICVVNSVDCSVDKKPGEYFSAVWNEKGSQICAISKSCIEFHSTDDFSLIESYQKTKNFRTPATVVRSLSDKYYVVTEKNLVANIYSTSAKKIIGTIQDQVDKCRIHSVVFDRFGENILVAMNSINDSFRAYDTYGGQSTRVYQDGPKGEILELLSDPLEPIIYARDKYTIYQWSLDTRFRMRRSVPEQSLLFTNEVYEEKETEFDKEEEEKHEEVQAQPNVLTCAPYYPIEFDSEFPNQIIQLPVDDSFFE